MPKKQGKSFENLQKGGVEVVTIRALKDLGNVDSVIWVRDNRAWIYVRNWNELAASWIRKIEFVMPAKSLDWFEMEKETNDGIDVETVQEVILLKEDGSLCPVEWWFKRKVREKVVWKQLCGLFQ